MTAWRLRCTVCGGDAGEAAPEDRRCAECGTVLPWRGAWWDFLAPDRATAFVPFLSDYQRIRTAEGRGAEDSAYYRALPDVPPGDPLAHQWHIRARTIAAFERRVLPRLGTGLRVVDCGAGCGWLSYRLRRLGHSPFSVDINDDARDGLGALVHFAPDWPAARAEFDALPLANGSADLVVFNGTLHYSNDLKSTLTESLRVLRPGGHIVVLDSPLYFRAESGPAMLSERQQAHVAAYGVPFRSCGSVEYLSVPELGRLERELDLNFQWTRVWYGRGWWWNHLRARLRGERERATFAILAARRVG